MISYPGDILQRFGRYEAVEELGVEELGHFWRAWDPFLERFVCVAALPDLDPTELHRMLPKLDRALEDWLGGCEPEAVLDFDPGNSNAPAFFVLRLFEPPDHTESETELPVQEPMPTRTKLPFWQQWSARFARLIGRRQALHGVEAERGAGE